MSLPVVDLFQNNQQIIKNKNLHQHLFYVIICTLLPIVILIIITFE